MKKEILEKLFNQYKKAFDNLDLKAIAGLHADTFLFLHEDIEEETMKKLGFTQPRP